MIKRNKITKLFLLSLIFVSISMININRVDADCILNGTNKNPAGSVQGETPHNTSNPTGPGGSYDCGGGLTATCWSTTALDVWSRVYVDMYDTYGNEICDPLNAERCLENEILAGTYVGLNVYEVKGYKLTVRTGAYGIQEYKVCKMEVYQYTGCQKDQNGKCIRDIYNWVNKGENRYKEKCPAGGGRVRYTETGTEYKWTGACGAALAHCKAIAKPQGSYITLSPSYEVTYRDSNDIDETGNDGEYKTTTTVQGSKVNQVYDLPDDENSSNWVLYEEKTFYYNRGKTCINVKNGKVKYINNNESCNEDGDDSHYTVVTNGEYWKYFIPLNANSADDFSFTMHSSGNVQRKDICTNIINNYNNFADLIRPISGSFQRVTSGDTPGNIVTKKEAAKRMVDAQGGCYYETTIRIPITQRFYNEVNSGQNFKGFNFYCKPIEIDNPFPNGLTGTSLWYDWSQDLSKNPNLTESYNEITYVANTSGNEEKIREYTETYPYTNWYNMYVDGRSSFIEREDIVGRNPNFSLDDIYALGCGPKNSNVTNIFMQPECDIE